MDVIGEGPEARDGEQPPRRRLHLLGHLFLAESLAIACLVTAAAALMGSGLLAGMGFVTSVLQFGPEDADPYQRYQVVPISHAAVAVVGGALGWFSVRRADEDTSRWAPWVAAAGVLVAVVALLVAAFAWFHLRSVAPPVPFDSP
jgi:hypothetical protein